MVGQQIKAIETPYQNQLKIALNDVAEGAYFLSITDKNTGLQQKAKLLIIK